MIQHTTYTRVMWKHEISMYRRHISHIVEIKMCGSNKGQGEYVIKKVFSCLKHTPKFSMEVHALFHL